MLKIEIVLVIPPLKKRSVIYFYNESNHHLPSRF